MIATAHHTIKNPAKSEDDPEAGSLVPFRRCVISLAHCNYPANVPIGRTSRSERYHIAWPCRLQSRIGRCVGLRM